MKATMGKVVGLLVVVFAAGFVLIVAGVVLVWATGWVTEGQMREIVVILKGEEPTGTETGKPEGVEKALPREREELEAVRKARKAQEEILSKVQLETERKKAELESVRQDAQRAVTELDARVKALKEEEKRFETAKRAYEESLASEGTRKLKETLEEMDAQKAAEMLYGYDLKTAARVLGAMRKEERAAIIEATFDMDKKRGLTDATGRAGQIIRELGNPGATS